MITVKSFSNLVKHLLLRLHFTLNLIKSIFVRFGKNSMIVGILAILGFLGFGIGLIGYKVDRIESNKSSTAISSIDKKINELSEKSFANPANRVPRFYGEIDSGDTHFVDFVTANDSKVVYLGAYIDPLGTKIDLDRLKNSNGGLVRDFHYYYKCEDDMPQELLQQKNETWDWREHCDGAELHIDNPDGTDSIWYRTRFIIKLEGYWRVNIPGTAMGSLVIRLSPIDFKSAI